MSSPNSPTDDRKIWRWMSAAPILIAILTVMEVAKVQAGIVPWLCCFAAGGLGGAVLRMRKAAGHTTATLQIKIIWELSLAISVAARVIAGANVDAKQMLVIGLCAMLPFMPGFATKE